MSERKMRFECPSEWAMDDIIISARLVMDDEIMHDEENDIPILRAMRIATQLYEGVLTKDTDEIKLNLQKIDEEKQTLSTKDLENQGLSIKVVDHVIDATKAQALRKLNLNSEAEIVESKIVALTNLNDMEKSTLSGLKSIAFSNYHIHGISRAICLARIALQSNKKCAVFYFILAKNLRRDRRRNRFHFDVPDTSEKEAFFKAYELSKNPIFGIRLAQCYKELKNFGKSKEMHYNILATNPISCLVQLRLALGFMAFKDFQSAKECLDFVEARQPKCSMFLHYKGLFLMKTHNYSEAAVVLKKAAHGGNFPAAMNYIESCEKMNPRNNAVGYLKELLEKNKNQVQKQELNLHLAMYLHLKLKDSEEALKYFAEGINIDPEKESLKRYTYTFTTFKRMNVYDFLERDFLRQIRRRFHNLSKESKETYEKLTTLCEQRSRAVKSLTESIAKFEL